VSTGDVPGSLRAYERYRRSEGPDSALLAHVAALVLEKAARSDDLDLRKAAFSQLRLAGTKARPSLARLSEVTDVGVRAQAFELLALLGDRGAQEALRPWLSHPDPAVVRAAVVSLDASEDARRLLELCGHTASDVREAAARRLYGETTEDDVRVMLADLSRVDPSPAVRSQAVRSLAPFGTAAAPFIRERLSDPQGRVRMAAVRALVLADRDIALAALTPMLEMTPSPEGIEAARSLAVHGENGGQGAAMARAYLKRTLASLEPSQRAQAAVALSTLEPDPVLDRLMTEALSQETDDQVRLSLARAMLRQESTREVAVSALETLLANEGMPGLQAAAALAREGSDAVLSKLEQGLRREDPAERRVAARALARDAGKPDSARRALADEDETVRIHAAGAILAVAPS
jgi:HEAT repeat protein